MFVDFTYIFYALVYLCYFMIKKILFISQSYVTIFLETIFQRIILDVRKDE